MSNRMQAGPPGRSGGNEVAIAALAILVMAVPSLAIAAATGSDPFAPAVSAGNTATNFAIWVVRMLGFGGLVVSAVKAYFKKFDFVFLASVLAGILLIASAPLIINWLFGLGGLTDASSIGTYSGGTSGGGTSSP